MEPRDKIKECIKCKNIIQCWSLDIDSQKKDPNDFIIPFGSRLKLAMGLILNKFTMRQLHISFIISYINSFTESDNVNNISMTSVCVTEALLNCSTNNWDCPDDYKFEPKK